MSALPYLVAWVTSILSSVLADYIRHKQLMSTTKTRKVFTAFGKMNMW
jgi:hypothetical protein